MVRYADVAAVLCQAITSLPATRESNYKMQRRVLQATCHQVSMGRSNRGPTSTAASQPAPWSHGQRGKNMPGYPPPIRGCPVRRSWSNINYRPLPRAAPARSVHWTSAHGQRSGTGAVNMERFWLMLGDPADRRRAQSGWLLARRTSAGSQSEAPDNCSNPSIMLASRLWPRLIVPGRCEPASEPT